MRLVPKWKKKWLVLNGNNKLNAKQKNKLCWGEKMVSTKWK